MKNEAVILTTAKIMSFLNEHKSKSSQGVIEARLENMSVCKGSQMKLRIHALYDGKAFNQIISDCLPSDAIKEIHDRVANYCKQNTIEMSGEKI